MLPSRCAACRGYADNKIRENVECEIMQVVMEEARESYKYGAGTDARGVGAEARDIGAEAVFPEQRL
eukprot:356004-Chlamydomonas_euryale.AAC.1